MASIKTLAFLLLEQLFRNRDRLSAMLDMLLDYLHDQLESVVNGQKPKN